MTSRSDTWKACMPQASMDYKFTPSGDMSGLIIHTCSTINHKMLICAAWHRLGRGNVATQLPTPLSGDGLQPSRKLADYLPASLVGAFNEAGDMHDLYPWQVGSLLLLQHAQPYSPNNLDM